MDKNSNPFTAYSNLRKSIDHISDSLTDKHHSHMQCHKGCAFCCMNYSILPLEYHYIQEQLKTEGFDKNNLETTKDENACIFLSNNSCTIYSHRPVICRTHGLPLLYTNNDYEWELSTCELNFREFDYEHFSGENTFPQDKYNSRLYMLNKDFIALHRKKNYGEFERIPLRDLTNQL